MATFRELSPPDDTVFSATRPCVFTVSDEILTGSVNVNGGDIATIATGTITNYSNQYTVTKEQPGGSGDWVYTTTPTAGWLTSPTTVVITAITPAPADVESRTFTVGEGYTADHTATGLARMLEQFQNSTNLRALASSWLDRVQEFEDVAIQLLHDRSVETGTGDRLDGIGQIVNVTRGGLEDPEYRLRLQGELAILFSQGSLNEILAIVQLLIPDLPDGDIEAVELYPKTLYIRPEEHALAEDPQTIANLLRRAVAAATELLFVYGLVEDDELYTLSSQGAVSESSATLGLANNAQSTGGKMAGAK